jgi:hypothetical protein
MPSKAKTQVITVHLPASIYDRFLALEDFLNQSERSIWIHGVETTTRTELIHQVVKTYCLGGWGEWDPGLLPEDEHDTERLHLKLSTLEALEWKGWLKAGHAATNSELARKAIALHLQWSDYRRWKHKQLYTKILDLGAAGDMEQIRSLI